MANKSLILNPNSRQVGSMLGYKPVPQETNPNAVLPVEVSLTRNSVGSEKRSDGLWYEAPVNMPRRYWDGTKYSWLFEPQATNLVFYSTDFQDASWTGASKSATSEVSPIQGQDSTIVTTTTSFFSGLNKSITGSAGKYTIQIIAKKKDLDYIGIIDVAGGGVVGWFNLSNGTLGTISSGYSGTIEPDYNGSYRITLTRTGADQTPAFIQFMFTNTDASSSGAVGESYIFYAGVESGSVATSPIITAGSTVTRLADVASKTGISSLIGQTEGTLYIDLVGTYDRQATSKTAVALTGGADNIRLDFYSGSFNLIALGVDTGAAFTSGQQYKVALVYANTSLKWFINGALYNSYTVTPSTFSAISLGSVATVNLVNTTINNCILYKAALSDSEAIELTTI